ncbi:hypothetical protein BMF94_5089 [Rhodotorula taiwanensis]|uniref:PITH domain-containing protein n=1 Tax=Rhodotorula taiwanensis TaxID=741276 RepID=A0A2S5B4M8_9BASI|nr:hypothetical protein BMF94_5089 [Rhodotorula taiwanensis]
MANCADDLTQVDYDASAAANSHLAGTSSTSSNNSLFPLIDFTHSHALNIDSNDPDNALKRVLRPLDSRDTVLDNDQVIGTVHAEGGVYTAGSIETQDGDDELLIHVRFSELVRIKTILIGTGGGRLATSPHLCRVWVNRGPGGTTFDEASSGAPTPAQEFELLESTGGQRGAVEYPVRIARFANCSDVDLAHARGEQTRLYYLGFIGESRVLKKEANEPMTIGAENAAPSLLDGVKEEKRGGATTSAR